MCTKACPRGEVSSAELCGAWWKMEVVPFTVWTVNRLTAAAACTASCTCRSAEPQAPKKEACFDNISKHILHPARPELPCCMRVRISQTRLWPQLFIVCCFVQLAAEIRRCFSGQTIPLWWEKCTFYSLVDNYCCFHGSPHSLLWCSQTSCLKHVWILLVWMTTGSSPLDEIWVKKTINKKHYW